MFFNEQLTAAFTDDSPKLLWKTPVVQEREGMDAKKARFLAALDDWTTAAKARRDQDAAARKTLKGNDRLHAHRRAELEGLARYHREHPRADVAPGLFSLIVLLSDNDEYGACYLSISTPGGGCSAEPRTASGMHFADWPRQGSSAPRSDVANSTLCWPLLHASFGDKPSLHWLVEYYSPRRELGRPRKNPLSIEGGPISGNPQGVEGEGVSENPSASSPKTSPPPPRDDFSLDASKGRKCPPSKVTGLTEEEVDAGFTEWWAHYPRKDDKLDAKKAYATIVRGRHKDPECRATIPQLLAALKTHKFPKEREYIKHPATWLTKGSWMSGAVGARGVDDLEVRVEWPYWSNAGRELVREMGAATARAYIRSNLSSRPSSCRRREDKMSD